MSSPRWDRIIATLQQRWLRLTAFWAPVTGVIVVLRLLPAGGDLRFYYLLAVLLMVTFLVYLVVMHLRGMAANDVYWLCLDTAKRLATGRRWRDSEPA